MVSPALASEVGGKEGDVLLTRLQKPSEVPIESLFGRKEDIGRTVRLTLSGVLPRDRLGEFSVKPQQADVRAVFAPIRRLQRDLARAGPGQYDPGVRRRDEPTRGCESALQLEDLGVRVTRRSESPRSRRHRQRQRHRHRGARDGCARCRRQAGAPAGSCLHLSGEHNPQGRSADPVLARDGDGSEHSCPRSTARPVVRPCHAPLHRLPARLRAPTRWC